MDLTFHAYCLGVNLHEMPKIVYWGKNINLSSAEFAHTVVKLVHLCLASHKRDIGKQCRVRSDVIERGV